MIIFCCIFRRVYDVVLLISHEHSKIQNSFLRLQDDLNIVMHRIDRENENTLNSNWFTIFDDKFCSFYFNIVDCQFITNLHQIRRFIIETIQWFNLFSFQFSSNFSFSIFFFDSVAKQKLLDSQLISKFIFVTQTKMQNSLLRLQKNLKNVNHVIREKDVIYEKNDDFSFFNWYAKINDWFQRSHVIRLIVNSSQNYKSSNIASSTR